MSKSCVTLRVACLFVLMTCVVLARVSAAQGLTGALIGTVRDGEGGVLPGAVVRVTSPALIGRELKATTNEKGQLRFPALPPGSYSLDIEMPGFATYHEEDISIGAGATIERTVVLKLAGVAESVTVQGAGSRIEARGSGLETRLGPRTSGQSRPGGSACSIWSGRLRGCRRRRRRAARPPPSPPPACRRSVRASTRTSF